MLRLPLALIVALIISLAVFGAFACDDDDDDDDDDNNNPAGDDDSTDDDTTAGDDDDDDDDDNDSADDDDDDDTPTGPAPLISDLFLLPDNGFAGDTVSLSFFWQDLEGDVNGGEVVVKIDGTPVLTTNAVTAGDNSGYVDLAVPLADDVPEGDLLFEVTLTDLAGNPSNTIGETFTSYGANTAPTISNLRFDPDPACTADGATFAIVFDYQDAEANLDGGTVSIVINGMFPPLTGTLSGAGSPTGTLGLQFGFEGGVPNNEVVNFVVQMADNRGASSGMLSADLTFLDTACDK